MLVYGGIDEAGYGPLLGPLCIGCTTFTLEDHDPERGATDLWVLLERAVCRSRRDRRHRIAVDDSKRLKGSPRAATHPLKHLERAVLAFLLASADEDGPDPGSLDESSLLTVLGVEPPSEPWYGPPTPLPVGQTMDAIRIDASRLRRTMSEAGVRCTMFRCEVIDAADLNAQVRRMGTKASANLCAVLRLAEAAWSGHDGAHPHLVVDRQGGRRRYRDDLQRAWPDARIRVLDEASGLSRYRIHRDPVDRTATISFQGDSERNHLPVALASMAAKYVRELLMLRLNRYFGQRVPGLRPTAGYVQDGRRYLREIAPIISREGIDRATLVRSC